MYLGGLYGESSHGKSEYPDMSPGMRYVKWTMPYESTLYKGDEKAVGLTPVMRESEMVMKAGKTYVVHIYHIEEGGWGYNDDVIVDVYPVDVCNTQSDQLFDRYQISRKTLSCSEQAAVTDTLSDASEIKNKVKQAWDDETEFKYRITASSDVKSSELVHEKLIFGAAYHLGPP